MAAPVLSFLESVFGGLGDGVAVAEADGTVLYLNPKAESLLGIDAARAQSGSLCGLLCARLSSAQGDDCAAGCPLREPGEIPAVTVKGEHGPWLAYDWKDAKVRKRVFRKPVRVRCMRTVVPGLGREGEEKHLVFMEDASAEAALEREREDWRSMVAHDLRTPLTNVFGTLRVLADIPEGRPLAAGEARLAQSALRSCLRLLELLNLFLDISRLESGAAPPRREAVALLELAWDTVQEQEAVAREKGIVVELDVPKDFAVLGDRMLLARVLENLLGNALKFTQAGGQVKIAARAKSEWEAELSVSDNGPGIPAVDMPFLFERFQRGHSAGKAKGSGLGLAFCRAAVRAMGGEIAAESKPGRGAVFVVTLPAGRAS